MPPRVVRSRSFPGIAVAAALALVLGVLTIGAVPSAAAVPTEEPISPAVARIVTVDATVRAEPSHGAAAVASLAAGDEVSVSAQVPAWRKVTVGGTAGWVPYSITQEVPRTINSVRRELNSDVTMLAQPGAKAAPVAAALRNSYAVATAAAGSWRKIKTANGAGWVSASTLERVTAGQSYGTTTFNVRRSAAGSTPVVSTLKKGQKVKVLGTRGAWSSVRWESNWASPEVSSGWTATKYLIAANVRVTTAAVNLRSRPWTGSVLTVIPKGALVKATGSSWTDTSRTPSTWVYVAYGSRTGWVAAKYLTLLF